MTPLPFPTVTHIVASVWNFHSNHCLRLQRHLAATWYWLSSGLHPGCFNNGLLDPYFQPICWLKPLGENGNSSIRTLAVVSQSKRVKLETLLGMLICTKICSSINVVQLHFHIISQHLNVLLQLIYTLLLDHVVS